MVMLRVSTRQLTYFLSCIYFARNAANLHRALLLVENDAVMGWGKGVPVQPGRAVSPRQRRPPRPAAPVGADRRGWGRGKAGAAAAGNAPGTRRGARFQKLRRARGGRRCVA